MGALPGLFLAILLSAVLGVSDWKRTKSFPLLTGCLDDWVRPSLETSPCPAPQEEYETCRFVFIP
jgi:hypothetical protein